MTLTVRSWATIAARGPTVAALLVFASLLARAIRAEDPARAPREMLVVTPRNVQLLRARLSSPDRSQRSLALDALRRLGRSETAASIRPLLDDPEPAVRADALLALQATLAPRELVPLLCRVCGDSSDQVAGHAFAALGRSPGAEAYQSLVGLGDGLPASRRRLWARALAQRAESPSPSLLRTLLRDDDPELRAVASTCLIHHPEVLPEAERVAMLSDPDARVRAGAVQSLGGALSEAPVRSALLRMLRDGSYVVRRAALDAFRDAPPSRDEIGPLFDDPDSTVRRSAVRLAARLGQGAAAELIARLGDREVLVPRTLDEHWAELASDETEALLVAQLADARPQVVAEAARALGRMGRESSVNRLLGVIEHDSPVVRRALYDALGWIGSAEATPVLLRVAAVEEPRPRAALNGALGRIGDRRAVVYLVGELGYGRRPVGDGFYPPEDNAVAAAAARALGQIGDARAATPLRGVAGDWRRGPRFWTAAVWSLGELGDDRAAGVLDQLGISGIVLFPKGETFDVPDAVRIEALRAIGKLGQRDLAARIIDMPPSRCSLEVRKAAAEVLTALTGRAYAFRLPSHTPNLAIIDLDVGDAPALAICYPVEE